MVDNGDDNDGSQDGANEFNDDEVLNEAKNLILINDNWSVDVETDVATIEIVELISKLLKKCRSIATGAKRSCVISNFIRSHQVLHRISKTLNIDCRSRWNSTYSLIDAINELKPVLIKLFVEKKSLELRKEQLAKLTIMELDNKHWEVLSSLLHVLRPFFYAIIMMSGKNYSSVGLCYHALDKLKLFCENNNNNSEHIKEMKKLLLAKIYQYFYYDTEQLEYFQVC